MTLTKTELQCCLVWLGYEPILEFTEECKRENIRKDSEMLEHLKQKGILKLQGNRYEFTALAQYVFYIMSKPEAWVQIVQNKESKSRRLYICDEDLLCMNEDSEKIELICIPSLPLFIGALSETLNDMDGELTGYIEKNKKLLLKRDGNIWSIKNLEKEEDFCTDKKQDCVCFIMQFLFKELKERKCQIYGSKI